MINYFRKEMHRPLVGIGHSMGGCHLYVHDDTLIRRIELPSNGIEE